MKELKIAKYLIAFFLCFTLTHQVSAEDFLGVKGEKHSSIGIYIKDLAADTIVFESNSERCHVPASVTKAYTSASAMSLLKPDFQFETHVYYTGNKNEEGELDGNLIIKASGDPTLESEYFPDNQGFIQEILDALKGQGIKEIKGDILLARVNENHDYQEGPIDTWSINDVGWTYGAGIYDFNWCDNYFGLYPATGKTTSPVPGLKYKVWKNSWSKGTNIIRGIYSDSLIVVGRTYATNNKAHIYTPMPYPFEVFRARLLARLKKNDISITEEKSKNTDRTLLVTHRSPLLDDILRSLMVRSDNMFAEGMLRVLGDKYGDKDASLDAEYALWESRGLQPQFNRIQDGSGLSRTNAISPVYLGSVLEWMAKSDMAERYVKLFPVSGKSGTMKSFLKDTPLKGRMAMKTGSVNAVQCYAGYMTDKDGKPTHVVVFMATNFFCTRAELRSALSKFLVKKLSPWF